jgi:hypothetical protein
MDPVVVTLHTNIDCCKQFMRTSSGLSTERFNPQIGDWIRVYHHTGFEIEMQVIERRWKLTNGSSPELHCWLGKPNGLELSMFYDVLKQEGFSLS